MFGFVLPLLLAADPSDGAVQIRSGGQVVAADQAGDTPLIGQGAPIDIDVQDAEISSVLQLIGAVGHLNFVLDDDVHGTVTAHLERVPWDLALAAILQSKGLVAVPFGDNILLVQAHP